MEANHSPPILFGSGAIAICAMILPGISGSFILLILGQYKYCVEALSQSLDALRSLDFSVLLQAALGTVLPFGLGAAFGLALFARLLGWLLQRYGQVTVGLLVGFMIGSLNRLWPFKHYTRFDVDRHGDPIALEWSNIWPIRGEHNGLLALALFAGGFLLITIVDQFAHRRR